MLQGWGGPVPARLGTGWAGGGGEAGCGRRLAPGLLCVGGPRGRGERGGGGRLLPLTRGDRTGREQPASPRPWRVWGGAGAPPLHPSFSRCLVGNAGERCCDGAALYDGGGWLFPPSVPKRGHPLCSLLFCWVSGAIPVSFCDSRFLLRCHRGVSLFPRRRDDGKGGLTVPASLCHRLGNQIFCPAGFCLLFPPPRLLPWSKRGGGTARKTFPSLL